MGAFLLVTHMFFLAQVRKVFARDYFFLLLAIGFPLASHAQMTLPVTVVTATKVPQRVEDVLADVSVVSREDIVASGAATVETFLATLPGIQMVSTGQAGVYMRGADPRMVAVFIDGVRVDYQDKNGAGARFAQIPLSTVERIEVIRGPVSGVYGANAMAGAIQIFTYDPELPSQRVAELGVGSDGYQFGAVTLGDTTEGGARFRLSANATSGDGYDSKPELANVSANLPFSEQNLSLGVDLPIDNKNNLRVNVNALSGSNEYVDQWSSSFPNNLRSNYSNVHTGAQWSHAWRSDLDGSLSVSNSRLATEGGLPDAYVTRASAISYDLAYRADAGVFTAALERKYDRLRAVADVYNTAVYAGKGQNAIAVGFGRLRDGQGLQVNLRLDDDEIYGLHRAWSAAYGIALDQRFQLSFGAGTGVRSPTVEQIYGQYGNRAIKAESSRTNEVSLTYREGSNEARVTAYASKYVDKFGNDSSFNHVNIDKASVEGVTFSASKTIAKIRLSGSLDFMDARDDTTNKRLNLRAHRSASLSISAPVERWRVGGSLRARGFRYHEAANTNRLPGDGLLDLSAQRKIVKDWSLKVRVQNALDKVYRDQKDDLAPGRQIYVGAVWSPR